MLIALADVKDTPVTLAQAAPQIEQFLFNKKSKEAADAELKRLRATAKIEYFNQGSKTPAAGAAPAPAASAPPVAVPAAAPAATSSSEANDRGVAGLK